MKGKVDFDERGAGGLTKNMGSLVQREASVDGACNTIVGCGRDMNNEGVILIST